MNANEVQRVLAAVEGAAHRLLAALLYGTGMRMGEIGIRTT